MPSTEDSKLYTLSIFGQVRQFLQAIQKTGADPSVAMQKVIDDPEIRQAFIRLTQPNAMSLPDVLDKKGQTRLFQSIFGLPPRVGHYTSRMKGDFEADTEKYNDSIRRIDETVSLRGLIAQLNPREISMLTMRFGLKDGKSYTLDQIGKAHHVSGGRARQIEQEALGKLRRNVQKILRLQDNPDSIENLDLSDRPANCLRRARIDRISELISWTADDLRDNLVNFGDKSLAEVEAKLAERGLSLKQ